MDTARTKYIVNENHQLVNTQLESNISSPIRLDRTKYAVGQVVHILGKIPNNDIRIYNNGNINIYNNGEIRIKIEQTHYSTFPSGCYKPLTNLNNIYFALVEFQDGAYKYNYIPSQPGIYIASIVSPSTGETFETIFEVINPFISTTFLMLLVAIGFFISLIFLTVKLSLINKDLNNEYNKEKSQRKMDDYMERPSLINKDFNEYNKEKSQRKMDDYIEIAASLRFLFISALVSSIIFALVFTEVEIGTHSPFGLVLRHDLNPEGNELDANKNPLIDWVINIGGTWENNFSSGVVIPIYVIILGLIGGYLRYLNKAVTKEREPQSKDAKSLPKIEEESSSWEFAKTTDGELSNIFLAPLLAAVVWFIISQGQTDFNIYGMAAISFSIGLVTTEIIKIIVKFMEKIIPS